MAGIISYQYSIEFRNKIPLHLPTYALEIGKLNVILQDVQIWAKAASQILFSLSLGFGSQMILSTYNDFHNNTQRDAVIISICNSLTSVYAGFVVFGILGFMAAQTGSEIKEVR